MSFRNRWWWAGCAALVSGCAVPPVVLTGHAKETARLTEAMSNQRVALQGGYTGEHGYCAQVEQERPFEKSIAIWAPRQVTWEKRTSADVLMVFNWQCGFDESNSTTGLTGTLSLLTLGLSPAVYVPRMRLHVRIYKTNKALFEGKYEVTKNVTKSLWGTNERDFMKEYYSRTAGLLLEQFTKELERDGALEP